MKVGFIGLGNLGSAIAKRLISQDIHLTVWNRTHSKAADFFEDVANSPADVASKTDVIFLNLFDSYAVDTVLNGENGVTKTSLQDKIVIDTSTNHHEKVLSFHKIIKKHGGTYLECPVLGSVVPASQGTLTLLVSGEKTAYECVLPLLNKIGKTIFYLEQPSKATKMKLINNLVLGIFMAGIGEAVAFAEKAGISKETAIDILASGAGSSGVLNAKRDKVLKEDFSTHFSTALIYKDLHCLQDLANNIKKPLLVGSIVKEIFATTFGKNMSDLDFSAIYKIFKDM